MDLPATQPQIIFFIVRVTLGRFSGICPLSFQTKITYMFIFLEFPSGIIDLDISKVFPDFSSTPFDFSIRQAQTKLTTCDYFTD